MHLLIPAAGVGKRMGADGNKLLLPLLDYSIMGWTLKAAVAASTIEWIGIICQAIDEPVFKATVANLSVDKPVAFIRGGDTRQASVNNGLQALPANAQHVLIHDGARCLATPTLFDRCAAAFDTCQGFIAAVPVKDTIKEVNDAGVIEATPDRSRLWAAQTPQGFDVALLKEAHQKGYSQGWSVTDDAALFEKCGLAVHIVEGEETNLKVTTPVDLAIAEFILRQRL
ncbi:2-c-methyl-d-erythritol 4-phosphate cytidylyltransferase [Leptolyngbya sp. Heron Island J]|uniref:2-C-methyl-D-erythritol 4-phosphate cytidylyltransferase n=1 Tax=Leptolyngbya sp. Heron Island J TaxID=1385935 RepID=UPI0003B9B180|nr:2-C-methyl-D-erythritol 4-phosphate cytidylyltransferase [Leptolyngbya sp. Heron Island J]ESA33103.1 2-c-methyl-d-erythritol 4-phosphate cytidylyltransferase [Leptolyngbya sp. Heron Island J]